MKRTPERVKAAHSLVIMGYAQPGKGVVPRPGSNRNNPLKQNIMPKITPLPVPRQKGAKMPEPTPEELEAMAKKAAIQKRNSLAEIMLSNGLHSGFGIVIDVNGRPNYKPVVDAAIEAADYFMEKLYHVKVTVEE